MSIRHLPIHELTAAERDLWAQWQRTRKEWHSPFLRPEFIAEVAAVRPGIEVAIWEQDGQPVGFLPFERRGQAAVPVGFPLCDLQAVITAEGAVIETAGLVRQCGLKDWTFSALVDAERMPTALTFEPMEYVYIDLERGFETYVHEKNASGSEKPKQVKRKLRQITREVGPVRVEQHHTATPLLETLITWKRAQYLRTGVADIFSVDWTAELLTRLLNGGRPELHGELHVVYAGEQLIAMEYALRSYDILHGWFPVYNADFARYSPGNLCTYEMARLGAEEGVRRYDFGKANLIYKNSFCTAGFPVARATLGGNLAVRTWQRWSPGVRAWVRSSRWASPLRRVAAWTRSWRGELALR